MAKLAARRKLALLVFRRKNPDEILVVDRPSKGRSVPGPLTIELQQGEHWVDVAGELGAEATESEATDVLDLGLESSFKVKEGAAAGEWQERFFAVEVPADSRAAAGTWMKHYDAKAAFASARHREAVTILREKAKLKP